MTTGVGLIAGWAIRYLTRRYRHGVQQLTISVVRLQRCGSTPPPLERQLRETRGIGLRGCWPKVPLEPLAIHPELCSFTGNVIDNQWERE